MMKRNVKEFKNVIEKEINFDDYYNCLFNETKEMKKINIIRSKEHDIHSIKVNKIALSAKDDKKIICKIKLK